MSTVTHICSKCGKSHPVPNRYQGRELKCPTCGEEFRVDGAVPSTSETQSPDVLLTTPPRPLYLFLWAFLFVIVAIWDAGENPYGAGETTILLYCVAWCGFAYWFFSIYRIHQIAQELTLGTHPISPAKAVWFHFIPLFNVYWMFKWPVELARMLNAKAGRTIVPAVILGLSVFFGFGLLRYDAALGLAALSLWMAFVLNRVYQVVDHA